MARSEILARLLAWLALHGDEWHDSRPGRRVQATLSGAPVASTTTYGPVEPPRGVPRRLKMNHNLSAPIATGRKIA